MRDRSRNGTALRCVLSTSSGWRRSSYSRHRRPVLMSALSTTVPLRKLKNDPSPVTARRVRELLEVYNAATTQQVCGRRGRLEQWYARHNHCAMVDAVIKRLMRSTRYLVIPYWRDAIQLPSVAVMLLNRYLWRAVLQCRGRGDFRTR